MNGVDVIYLRPLKTYRALTINAGLLSFCRKELAQYDVIHIYGLYDLMGPVVSHYAYKAHIPYVLEPLGMTRPIDRSFRLKRVWHQIFGKRTIRHAARMIATSQQEEKELLEDGLAREKVVLRYNGVDLNEFASLPERGTFRTEWTVADGEPVVLFLGRVIPRKGVDLLISAFAEACPQKGRLVVAGPEGEVGYIKQLRELARAKGVEAHTIFTGPLYGDQKKSALADCDLFVLPSRYENFANGVAEAIAARRPVIISDRCGIGEFVAEQVGLVVPREVSAIAVALRKLIEDQTLYRKFQEACPRVASRLSWTELLAGQEAIYEKVCGKRDESH
jgi:glycosyltransferase involved in cell wall biosynthesis